MPNDNPAAHPVAGTPVSLPPAEADPAILLDHIKETSQTARGSWFALLALLAFVGVTMMAHTDAAFFATGVATELPVVGIEVPTLSFFIAAPLLMAALYVHLHLYLISLWDALGDAPERIGPVPLIDRVHPTMIAQAAVLYRARARPDASAAIRAFGGSMVASTILLVWVATPALIAWIFWRSMPLHDPRLTLWVGACLTVACLFGYRGLKVARGRLSRPKEQRDAVHAHWDLSRRLSAVALAAVVAFVSWETTRGGLLPHDESGLPPLLVSANLREAELTPRPPNWKPFELWLRDLRRERAMGEADQNPLIPTEEEIERYRLMIAALEAPNLRGRDLRKADLTLAYLPGADLREAKLQGAWFNSAQIQGVILRDAEMRAARLDFAQMQGADLRRALMKEVILGRAEMQGANFSHALMQEADLRDAQSQGANFTSAQMQGSDLQRAKMQSALLPAASLEEANLASAQMQGANLRGAQMQGADLTQAQMQGADLAKSQMQGAELGHAKMEGVNLAEAQMQDADLSHAQMQGARLNFAQLQRADLRDAQLRGANLIAAHLEAASLSKAQMRGAHLTSAQMQGADLSGAEMQEANCTNAVFLATLVMNADLTCRRGTLSQAQLQFAVGSEDTLLPEGLYVWSCLDRDRVLTILQRDFDEAIANNIDANDGELGDFDAFGYWLFCKPDSDWSPIRSPQKVGRHPEPVAAD